jgi:DME family drug/metabolite transporter
VKFTAPGAGMAIPALIAASVLWGTTGTAASFMPKAVGPLAVGAATMCIGGILLFLFSVRGAVGVVRNRAARGWLVAGALGVFAYPLAFYSGMHLAGVAIGNVVALGSGPIFAALLEWTIEGRRPRALWLICTVVAVVGIGTLALFGHSGPGKDGSGVGPGILLSLLAGCAYALYTYSSSRVIRAGPGGRSVMGAMFGLGAVLLAPVLVLTGKPLLESSAALAISAYLIVIPMFVAYLLFARGLSSLSSSTVTTITLIEPLVATVLAVTVVGERLAPGGWVGLLLILVGVTVLATARLPENMP